MLSGCVASFLVYTYTILILTNQMLFPTIDIEDVNGAFQYGLQLIKEATINEIRAGGVEEGVLAGVEGWLPPPVFWMWSSLAWRFRRLHWIRRTGDMLSGI